MTATTTPTDTLRERALAMKAICDAEAKAAQTARDQEGRDGTLADAKRFFQKDLGVDFDDPTVLYYWSRGGGDLRVTTNGGLLIGFNGDHWQGNERYTLIRECVREGCQHGSDPIYSPFTSLYQLGGAIESQPLHRQDCTVEWDEEGDPVRRPKPRTERAIAEDIAEDLGVVIGTAPGWFLEYQLRVSNHVAKLHARINEVAAHPALSIPPL